MYTGPSIIRNGLVLALDAASKNSYPGSGTTWTDLSGNNNTSTITGASYVTDNMGAFQFTADNQYVTVLNSNTATFSPNNITVCCWANPTIAVANYHTLFSKWGNTNSYILYLTSTLATFDINSEAGVVQASINTLNNWNFYVATYDRANMIVYINGIEYNRTAYTGAIITGTNQNLILGTNAAAPTGRTLRGYMANSILYNRALSAVEVLQNYNAQKSRFNL